jgi:hypothetical protein
MVSVFLGIRKENCPGVVSDEIKMHPTSSKFIQLVKTLYLHFLQTSMISAGVCSVFIAVKPIALTV